MFKLPNAIGFLFSARDGLCRVFLCVCRLLYICRTLRDYIYNYSEYDTAYT